MNEAALEDRERKLAAITTISEGLVLIDDSAP